VSPWLGMALVLGCLGLLVGVVKVARARLDLDPEWARKLVHMGMGFVTLSFPWIFRDTWPVLALCGLSVGSLALLRLWSPLRRLAGGVLHGVDRVSFGEFYFPVSVACLFALTHGDPVRYTIPVLVLSLADAVAALVGTRYGQSPYTTKEGRKSWEGSLAFFVVGFFATHVPLLLFTTTGRLESLLIASTLALVVMLFEAIAWKGLDNLFVPLGTHFLLGFYLAMDARDLAARLCVTLGFVALTLGWRKRTTLDDAALLGASLAGYAFYALGGWPWVLPPLTLFLLYRWLNRGEAVAHRHSIVAVVGIAGPAILWLILHRLNVRGTHHAAFTTCFATHLAIAAFAHRAWKHPRKRLGPLAMRGLVLGLLPMVGVLALRNLASGEGFFALTVRLGGLGAGATVGLGLFLYLQPHLRDCPDDGPRWARQAVCGVTASGVAYLLTAPWL